MSAIVVGDEIVITSPHGKELKQLGARLNAGSWTLPATRLNAQLVNDLALGLPTLSVDLSAPGNVDDERLYGYQRDAAARLATAPHGLVLVAAPGLGKTAMAIAAADVAVPDDRVVIIAPASLLDTWAREIQKWARVPGSTYIMRGKVDHDLASEARWIITSWDKAVREQATWGKGWPLWILDESVLAKSRGSKRFKTLTKLRRDVQRFWLLSGSPTTRYSDDLWAQLHLLWPKAFSSYWRFAERYTVVEQTPWARVVTGDRVGRSAAVDNSDLVLVINEEDAGLDLPDYLFEPPLAVALEGPQLKAYKEMAKTFIAELENGTEVIAANEASKLLRLQQIASYFDGHSAKRAALLEVIGRYEPPYLIWTHWKDTSRDLEAYLTGAGINAISVTGETPDRDTIIEDYKAGNTECLILSLGVGKFGHTLTNTRTVFGLDRNFSADDYYQSMHRVRRIGLTHRPVVVPIVAVGTVDELTVGDNLEAKLGGISRMTRSDLASLLKGLGR
jgi:SNF2 family DNA or RNA helicase